MEKCVTIASTCNLFWRRELVPEDTIAIEPLNGWHRNQVNQSRVALEWLCYEDFKLRENRLHHVRNGGEQKVLTPGEALFVVGYDAETKTVYEFHDCFFHECPTCFPIRRQRKHYCRPDRTINEVYEAGCRKTRQLQQAGYTVIEKWECAFNKDKKTDLQLREFLKTFQLDEPLNPRDSFFGGRTNAVCLYAEAKESEAIHNVDINSLYPYVNKTKTYPVGHPDILVNPADQDIDSYFGIAKVKILAPPRLYHPVLPVRAGGKLTFLLCGKCVEEQLETPWLKRTEFCSHTIEERYLTGTWCTPELQKAVKLGYENGQDL